MKERIDIFDTLTPEDYCERLNVSEKSSKKFFFEFMFDSAKSSVTSERMHKKYLMLAFRNMSGRRPTIKRHKYELFQERTYYTVESESLHFERLLDVLVRIISSGTDLFCPLRTIWTSNIRISFSTFHTLAYEQLAELSKFIKELSDDAPDESEIEAILKERLSKKKNFIIYDPVVINFPKRYDYSNL